MPLTEEQKLELRLLRQELDKPSQGEKRGLTESERQELQILRGDLAQEDVGFIEAGARSLAEGLTLGFSEELLEIGADVFLDDQAAEAFAQEQQLRREAGERNFSAFTTGAEIVGNIGSSVAAAGAVATAAAAAGVGTVGAGTLAALGLGGAAILGAIEAAGKSEAEAGSDQFNQDLRVGAAFGLAGGALGAAGGKIISKAGGLLRNHSDEWIRAGATGRLGPGAEEASKKYARELVDLDMKFGQKGVGQFGKTSSELAEDLADETTEAIQKRIDPFKVRTIQKLSDDPGAQFSDTIIGRRATGAPKATQPEVPPRPIERAPSVPLEFKAAESELIKKRLKAVARSGTRQQRARAREELRRIAAEEADFLDLVSRDINGALKGEYGEEAQSVVLKELEKQARRLSKTTEERRAAINSLRQKASIEVQQKTAPNLRDQFKKEIEKFTLSNAALSLARGQVVRSAVQTLGAGARAGLPAPGRSALRAGLETAPAPVVAAGQVNPQGGQ